MYTITVSRNRSLTLPSAFKKLLEKGNRFIAFESDDSILLKQIRAWPADLAPEEKPMSLSEINRIVHLVRRKTRTQRRK